MVSLPLLSFCPPSQYLGKPTVCLARGVCTHPGLPFKKPAFLVSSIVMEWNLKFSPVRNRSYRRRISNIKCLYRSKSSQAFYKTRTFFKKYYNYIHYTPPKLNAHIYYVLQLFFNVNKVLGQFNYFLLCYPITWSSCKPFFFLYVPVWTAFWCLYPLNLLWNNAKGGLWKKSNSSIRPS